ncbi:fibrohexamerin [Plutella xylostella]|uniref:fibrohexamerin n=1 Tax=Plutella xylostella TaxID=51655 RepID=UPI002032E0A9|nr:fibrohexamerin [Plutella xylostella]
MVIKPSGPEPVKMKLYSLVSLVILLTGSNAVENECPITQENPTRPCPKNTIKCVKKYFHTRADCLSYICPVNSNTIQLENFKNYEPSVNATIVQNATLTGVGSGTIYDFIIDKTINIAVLSIEYTNIKVIGTSDFIHYKTAREPKTVRIDTTENYRKVIITTYFYDTEDLNLEDSYSVANLTLPEFTLGPCLTQSTDPETVEFFGAFLANINAVAQEAYQTRAPLIQKYFISKHICNYVK